MAGEVTYPVHAHRGAGREMAGEVTYLHLADAGRGDERVAAVVGVVEVLALEVLLGPVRARCVRHARRVTPDLLRGWGSGPGWGSLDVYGTPRHARP